MISPSPSEPSMTAQLGNAATLRTVRLVDLVLDSAYQCRAGMDDATVSTYAQHLSEGGTFPPVRAMEVEGRLLLVDGWHRYRATERATFMVTTEDGCSRSIPTSERTIDVEVEQGDRRAALLAAVRANGDHGLPRSMADKRRAVRTLLGDAEWCKLSARELGKLAGVSHTFVDQRRAAYGVKTGTVLKDADIQRVDSEPPAKWRELLSETTDTYYRDAVEKVRCAAGPLDLIAAGALGEIGKRAQLLRRRELATEEWPWPEDVGHPSMSVNMAHIEARCARLDTIPDLVKAVCAANGILDDKQREQLYAVIEKAQQIKGARESYQVKGLRELLDGRAAFIAQLCAIDARRAVAEEKRRSQSDQPYDVGPRIMRMTDPTEQAAAILAVDGSALGYISGPKLPPEVRDGAYRERMIADGREGPPCVRPSCRGWTYQNRYGHGSCGICGVGQIEWTNNARNTMTFVAELLKHEGYGFVVDGVVIDRRVIDAIAGIRDNRSGTTKISGPVGIAVRKLVVQTPPKVMLVDPKQPEPEEEEPEEPEEDEEEGEDDDDGEEF